MQEENKKDSKALPQGPRGMRMTSEKPKFNKNTFLRVLSYMKKYKWQYIIVFICIIISSLSTVASQLFIKSLIDDYISPMLLNNSNDYSPLLNALLKISGIYIFGVTFTPVNI